MLVSTCYFGSNFGRNWCHTKTRDTTSIKAQELQVEDNEPSLVLLISVNYY